MNRAGWNRTLALLGWVLATGAQAQARPDVEPLPAEEYVTPLEEVIVRGSRAPAWRDRLEQRPRWERQVLELEEPEPPRLDWFPHYERDEREDYEGVRDRRDAEPRLRLFEFRF